MQRELHKPENALRILKLVADTMILVSPKGLCLDINTHSSYRFLQEDELIDKNLISLLPIQAQRNLAGPFKEVLKKGIPKEQLFELTIDNNSYYFRVTMYPYYGNILCSLRDLTERTKVTKELNSVNQECGAIQKMAKISSWKYDIEKRNITFRGTTGVSFLDESDTITIEQYCELIVKEDQERFMKWIEALHTDFNRQGTLHRIHLNEEIFYLKMEVLPLDLANLNERKGYIQNITDIQRHRNDINTLTHAINNSSDSIFAAKSDGSFISSNREFLKRHHLDESIDLTQIKTYEILGDIPTKEAWDSRCAIALKEGSINFTAEYTVPNSTTPLRIDGCMYPVLSDTGEISFWSFAHDISERLQYEAKIKQVNHIMDTTLDNLPASIAVKDINDNFRYIYYNHSLGDLLYEQDIIVGKTDFELFSDDVAKKIRKEDEQVVNTGKNIHTFINRKMKDGTTRYLDKQIIKVTDTGFSPILLCIEWDVTLLEQTRIELQAAKEKAETSDKLKSAFLANMSHEIRTPLNAIVGFSRVIAESDSEEERKKYYEIVSNNNDRLLKLINEILDLSKIESGVLEFTFGTMNPYELCNDVFSAYQLRMPEGVKLFFDPSPNDIVINSDKSRLFQVISNLVNNALKFTTTGKISFGFKAEDGRLIFYVSDTGTGISEDKLKAVFQRFVKLNESVQGTGLGLSICKAIVEKLGGEISVTSKVGFGTTFSFWLPYNIAGQDNSEQTMEEALESDTSRDDSATNDTLRSAYNKLAQSHSGNNKKKILIAEDSKSNFILLNAILRKEYDIVWAHDGMEAVTLFDSEHPDLILMDIKMPNLNGLEATQIIRQLSPDVPIIAQSAYAFSEDIEATRQAGCNDFISKPISQDLLKSKIKFYLNKES